MADRADVKILPPLVLLSAFAVGAALYASFPDAVFPASLAVWAGSALVAVSIVVAVLAARVMARAQTAFDVRRSTTTVVTSGVFGFTRNPVYLSMTLLYLGVSILLNSVPMSLVVVPLGSSLCLLAIKPEERYLESKFGASYRAYRDRVPRWL